MLSDEKIAEYYAIAKVLGFQQSISAFKIQYQRQFEEALKKLPIEDPVNRNSSIDSPLV